MTRSPLPILACACISTCVDAFAPSSRSRASATIRNVASEPPADDAAAWNLFPPMPSSSSSFDEFPEECLIPDEDGFDDVKDLDDVARLLGRDVCILDHHHPCEERHRKRQLSLLLDDALRFTPAVFPLLAFGLYDPVAQCFSAAVEFLSDKNWVAVDGGAYQAQIIAPAINGIVVPSMAILFANLVGNTITVLRGRQSEIRNSINLEAGHLRVLKTMFDTFPEGSVRDRCRYYLYRYTDRIVSEGHETIGENDLNLSGMDSELNAILAELTVLATSEDEADALPNLIVEQSLAACRKLLEERSRRITFLQSTFPPLHFVIVGTLASSICACFLMETDQSLLVFLNAIQLKILWSVLVGTFSALAVVVYDLQFPFRGSYQISKSVDQLKIIRATMRIDIENRKEKSAAAASAAATTKTTIRSAKPKALKQVE